MFYHKTSGGLDTINGQCRRHGFDNNQNCAECRRDNDVSGSVTVIQSVFNVGSGDLSKRLQFVCMGEVLELKNTINSTMDELKDFCREMKVLLRGKSHQQFHPVR